MNILIIGAGAWGKALAAAFSHSDNHITLWKRQQLQQYEPLPPAIDLIVTVIPSQAMRSLCIILSKLDIPAHVKLLICSKGIERTSLKMMSEVAEELLPGHPIAVLSGPNFAGEIEKGLPSATTIACSNQQIGNDLVKSLGSTSFRPYYSADIIGAQIGGAVKNVLAIACGITDGRGLGENARAALITRGLTEMGRLCVAKGGKLETLLGLSGMGDLILTCSSPTSRNMAYGLALGRNELNPGDSGKLTEGIASTESVVMLARKLGIDMPICEAVYRILYENADIDATIKALLQRPLASEML